MCRHEVPYTAYSWFGRIEEKEGKLGQFGVIGIAQPGIERTDDNMHWTLTDQLM
jgi:hypothetical protein